MDVERIGETLFVGGSVDRSQEQSLRTSLEEYCGKVPAGKRVVDMTHVRFFASTAAKILISIAQDTEDQGGRMRVVASLPVLQTLNLLGAKTWLDVTASSKPTDKQAELAAAMPAVTPGNTAPTKPATVPASATASVTITNTISAKNAGGDSGLYRAPLAAVSDVPQSFLAGEKESVPAGMEILKHLISGGTYRFHYAEGREFSGRVMEWIGGPWVIVDSHAGRKVVNLSLADWVDLL
jgi:anti-anti-sigma factor